MIITTPDLRAGARQAQSRRGFTLVEVMIAAALSSMIMAGILSAFLMMGRSGANAYNYVGMESDARQGLERFAEDVRMAYNVRWASATDLTLWMDSAGTASTNVRYYYDTSGSAATNPNYHCLVRYGQNRLNPGTAETKALIHNVQTDFAFDRWTNGVTTRATGDANTYQIQLRLTIRNTAVTAVSATNLVVSARYILRNK